MFIKTPRQIANRNTEKVSIMVSFFPRNRENITIEVTQIAVDEREKDIAVPNGKAL